MQWILCSMDQSILIECTGFNGASLNAEDSMHCVAIDPYCMQWSQWSEAQCIPIERRVFHAAWLNGPDWMQWIPCSVAQWISIECSGFHAVWCSGFWLIAVNSMHRGTMDPNWMQWIPCSVAQWISRECSGFHAVWCNGFKLNAVDSMHRGAMDPNWMQWIPCSVIECSIFHAAW